MSELVDRAARIINPQFDSFGHLGAAYVRQYQDETRAKARAILAAMRDPTEAMILAGVHHDNMGDMAGRWRAMIDAAILE